MINQDYVKEFNKLLQSVDVSKNKLTLYSDFLTLAICSISQPFYRSEEIEEKYLSTAKGYNNDQINSFAKMFALVVEALEEYPHDFLGNCFQSNEFGSDYKGQFFTPYHICQLMAKIQFVGVKEIIQEKGFITVSEPCVGAGGMIISSREILIQEGCNPSTDMFVEAIDIDEICFKMAYIQFSLLGIPARVIRGNTLSMQFYETLYTPLYFINGWHYKLNRKEKAENTPLITANPVIKIQPINKASQLSLF